MVGVKGLEKRPKAFVCRKCGHQYPISIAQELFGRLLNNKKRVAFTKCPECNERITSKLLLLNNYTVIKYQ